MDVNEPSSMFHFLAKKENKNFLFAGLLLQKKKRPSGILLNSECFTTEKGKPVSKGASKYLVLSCMMMHILPGNPRQLSDSKIRDMWLPL